MAATMDRNTKTAAPQETSSVAERLAELAVQAVLTGLRRRDQDDPDIPYHFFVNFAAKHGNTADVTAQLQALWSAGEAAVEDFDGRGLRRPMRVHLIDHGRRARSPNSRV